MSTASEVAALQLRAEQGAPEAMYQLARAHQAGKHGLPKSLPEAVKWTERAVAAGHLAAYNLLGCFYRNGDGVDKDAAQAFEYFRQGAELGHPAAQFNLAVMLQIGEACDINLTEALAWYRRAAEKNNAAAMFNAAVMLEEGQGCAPDIAGAIALYRQAAALNDTDAMLNLANIYESGTSVPVDLAEAVHFYELANSHGSQDAAAKLLSLAPKLAAAQKKHKTTAAVAATAAVPSPATVAEFAVTTKQAQTIAAKAAEAHQQAKAREAEPLIAEGVSQFSTKARLEAERHLLKQDIAKLEEQLRQKKREANHVNIEETMAQLLRQNLAEFAPKARQADTELPAQTANQLHSLAVVTGLSFTRIACQWRNLAPGGDSEDTSAANVEAAQAVREYTIAGESNDLEFSLVFDVADVEMNIVSLVAKVSLQVEAELAPFCKICSEALSPQLFLRGFTQFAEWHKQRRRLFRSLQQKFPAVATLPGGDGGWLLSLAIEGGGSALFSWRLNVDREGAVTSTLDLSPFNFVPSAACLRLMDEFRVVLVAFGMEEGLLRLVASLTRPRKRKADDDVDEE